MALQKQIEQNSGVVAQYHKILNMTFDNAKKQATILVASYLSKEARDLGKQPVSMETISRIQCQNGTMAECYSHLKSLEKYSGSQNV